MCAHTHILLSWKNNKEINLKLILIIQQQKKITI